MVLDVVDMSSSLSSTDGGDEMGETGVAVGTAWQSAVVSSYGAEMRRDVVVSSASAVSTEAELP